MNKTCTISNLYGPAETIICTYHYIDPTRDTNAIPIGLMMPNYRCLLLDDFFQHVPIGQEGQLFVGGVGVFAGYLEQDDLTAKVLVDVNGEIFYRAGDLVRMDNDGRLQYLGRQDHQVKLHGQRIELDEIERCLLNTSISACVVIKWGEDHLVAYIQSTNITEDQLQRHCESHLPPHMIPSKFIILEQLPLNPNGKIDRKRLPVPNFSTYSTASNTHHHTEPNDELERHIHSLWCQILSHTQIPTNSSFFHIGGHSLLLVQLYHNYKMTFNLNMSSLSIAKFSQHPTITDHARLLREASDREVKDLTSSSRMDASTGKRMRQ